MDFAARVPAFVRALGAWLRRGYPLWGAVLVPLSALMACRWLPLPAEASMRWAGLFVQLAGLLVVAQELARAQAAFKGGSGHAWRAALGWLVRYWQERPRWAVRFELRQAGAVSMAGALGLRGSVEAHRVEPLTLEERVSRLEDQWKEDRKEAQQLRTDLERHARETREALANEAAARQREVDRINRQLADTATGGIPDQVTGWTWLLAGAVLSSLPQEVWS